MSKEDHLSDVSVNKEVLEDAQKSPGKVVSPIQPKDACNYCGRRFKAPRGLAEHIRCEHMDELHLIKCEVCNQDFYSINSMEKYIFSTSWTIISYQRHFARLQLMFWNI